MRRFSRFRRFSATPRRRWFRRSPSATSAPRLQQCQFNGNFELFFDQTENSDNERPCFIVFSLAPWDNAPPGGFDQSFELRGIIFSMFVYPDSYESQDVGGGDFGLPTIPATPALYMAVCGDLFVDDTDPLTGAPVCLSPVLTPSAPYGPFVNTPPAGFITQPPDTEIMPTRHLLRKYGVMQRSLAEESIIPTTPVAVDPTGSFLGNNIYGFQNSAFRWAPRLRKRVTVGSRQGIFLALYATQDFNLSAPYTQIWSVAVTGTYYYRLKR